MRAKLLILTVLSRQLMYTSQYHESGQPQQPGIHRLRCPPKRTHARNHSERENENKYENEKVEQTEEFAPGLEKKPIGLWEKILGF